ncbi:hypothetical protein D9M68_390290 [compost metagenome]
MFLREMPSGRNSNPDEFIYLRATAFEETRIAVQPAARPILTAVPGSALDSEALPNSLGKNGHCLGCFPFPGRLEDHDFMVRYAWQVFENLHL